MTELWRVSRFPDLEGRGGEQANARWHTAAKGKRIVYLAEHPALALIEAVVNVRREDRYFPTHYQLMRITVCDGVSTETLPQALLSERWRDKIEETQFAGNAWLEQNSSALLGVPSAPAPESTNYLLNPLHPDAKKLIIEWHRWIEYDKRLFRAHPHST